MFNPQTDGSELSLEKSAKGVPPDMTIVSQLGLSWAVFHTVVFALRHGIFDHLCDRSASQEMLSKQFSIPARPMDVLTQVLAACGLLQSDDGSQYSLTPAAAAYLVSDRPGYIGYYLLRYEQLAHLLPSGIENVFMHDQPLDQSIRYDKRVEAMDRITLEKYGQGMAAWGYETAVYLAKHFDFAPFEHIVDVGGGIGTFAVEIARRYPHVHVSVFDLPGVADIVNDQAQQLGISAQITGVGGNIFKDLLPPDADLVLVSRFLDSWGDSGCLDILQRCYAALRPGGTLLIAEAFLNDTKTGPAHAAFWSLTLLMIVQGRHRSVREYVDMLMQTGFVDCHMMPLCSNQLLVAQKP